MSCYYGSSILRHSDRGTSMECRNDISVLFSILWFSITCFAQGTEKKIAQSELPAPVQHTVQRETERATLRGFSKEVEEGHTYYEVEPTVNGHSKDVLMDANGNVVEVEEVVTLKSLPQPVQEGLRLKPGAGTITKVESLTKNGQLVAYEAKVKSGSRTLEIQVDPVGKPLDHER